MPETRDIICEHCDNVVLGTLTRSQNMTDAQWRNAIDRSQTGYRCSTCGPLVRAPAWWPHGWWDWPPTDTPPPFWPDDMDWPPTHPSALGELRSRLAPRGPPP